MSCELYWEIVRNNSCFLVRRSGYEFSSEPNNVSNLNTFKFSGLSGNKTVSVSAASPKGVTLTICRSKVDCNMPSTRTVSIPLKRGSKRAAKTIRALVGNAYRPELVCAAVCRSNKIHKSQTRTPKPLKPKKARRVKAAL